jgi:hypothetical protein
MTHLFTSARVIAPLLISILFGGKSLVMAQLNQKPASSVDFYTEEAQRSSSDVTLLTSWKYLTNEDGLSVRLFPTSDPALITLLIANQTSRLLTITINTKKGEQLYEEVRPGRQTWGRWRLNLSELPDGEYRLGIQVGKKTINHPFVIETRAPVVYAHDRVVVF